MAGRWGMRQRAASEADWGSCKPFSPEALAPVGVWELQFHMCLLCSEGKGWQLTDREQDKAGKEPVSNSAGGSSGAHRSEAYNSQPTSLGMICGHQEKRALEMSISWLDGKASHSRSDSRRHSRERKDLGEVELLAFDLFLLIAPSRLLWPGKRGFFYLAT